MSPEGPLSRDLKSGINAGMKVAVIIIFFIAVGFALGLIGALLAILQPWK